MGIRFMCQSLYQLSMLGDERRVKRAGGHDFVRLFVLRDLTGCAKKGLLPVAPDETKIFY